MDRGTVTERVRASELGDNLRRKLGLHEGADVELEITVRQVKSGVRKRAGRAGFLEAKALLDLPDIDPEKREAELRADRDAWRD